ncbi:MAG TPA: formimidoylglutamate deiminase [Cyclobacteriaceae bacterium]|nr:formimidoylglutamate deiminase [Cyclobacteriaceae bacterium]HRJ80405.1 formimidoylglutamate deiminase [Cyclobacteriaceae bacterium]
MKYFQFKYLLQQEGWLQNAYVKTDPHGIVQSLSTKPPLEAAAIEYVNGFALPGFQNAHSHAFQFAMAGMAEKHKPGTKDDFWSWREAMYECALRMNPDEMEQVATACYKEMLRCGYTHVAEFHYLHHDQNGKPYANPAEMGERLLAAAKTAGIKITLVPVFYQQGGFGMEPQPRQRRFISKTIDDYFHLLDDTAHAVTKFDHARLGFGVHSLRAVKSQDIIRTVEQGPKDIPFHLHAAEQLKEVEDSVAFLKKRPIEWLLENVPMNDRFHLVHCTHMNDSEVAELAKSKAHAVLCPGTEGNLGDGIFRLTDFYHHGGRWSIGTDSHISLNPLEDLRWLDYAQRFTTHKRNTFDDGATVLVNNTLLAGRRAMGNSSQAYFEVGQPLDAVVYDAKAPLLENAGSNHALPVILYTADSSKILGTMINGRWALQGRAYI